VVQSDLLSNGVGLRRLFVAKPGVLSPVSCFDVFKEPIGGGGRRDIEDMCLHFSQYILGGQEIFSLIWAAVAYSNLDPDQLRTVFSGRFHEQ
jgi:hypothetical protein